MDEKRDQSSFDQRLRDARDRNRLDEPEIAAGDQKTSGSGFGLGARVGVELASALMVGVFIGIALDRWLHSSPVFLLLFFFVGAAAGLANVWRLVAPRKPGSGAQD